MLLRPLLLQKFNFVLLYLLPKKSILIYKKVFSYQPPSVYLCLKLLSGVTQSTWTKNSSASSEKKHSVVRQQTVIKNCLLFSGDRW